MEDILVISKAIHQDTSGAISFLVTLCGFDDIMKKQSIENEKGRRFMDKKIIAETDRLILRRYRAEDIQDLYEYLSNPKVLEYEPYKPMTMEEAKENLESRIASDEMIAVELKSTGKMIGNVYLGKCDCNSLELGYVFNEDYWNMGYARESCEKLIENAFEHGIHRISAYCDPKNPNSWELLEKLGFTREGFLQKNVYFWKDGHDQPLWKDTYIYGLLNSKEN